MTTFRALKVTSQLATPGTESAVYDCFVLIVFGKRELEEMSFRGRFTTTGRDAIASVVYTIAVCLSVCLSVTSRGRDMREK